MNTLKNEKNKVSDYSYECKKLKSDGLERLYLINGQEDYLSEYFLTLIKTICIPDGDNGFNYKKFDEYDFSTDNLSASLDALPFLSDRTLVELRNVDINNLSSDESEKIIRIISDIPDYCTVVFMYSGNYQLDGRLKLAKKLKEIAYSVNFPTQPRTQLISWVKKRFSAWNKTIDLDAIETLFVISGEKMKDLIPEIDKIAAYSVGSTVTISDVEKVANHIPSAVVFEVIDRLSNREYSRALSIFNEYTNENKYSGIPSLGLFSTHFRKLYMLKYYYDKGYDTSLLKNIVAPGKDFVFNKLVAQSKAFSLSRLNSIVNLLADADYVCKSTGDDQDIVAVNTLVDIIGGVVADDKNKRSDFSRRAIR